MTLALPLDSVILLTRKLDAAGIGYASGGSGLLYSLGLSEQVRDWDLTTDASYEEATAALRDFTWTASPSGDYPFASSFRISITGDALPVDIIGRFAVHGANGICRLPAIPSFEWQGIRMGSPEVWAAAYTLMDRKAKADQLFAYLKDHGADREAMQLLLAEPLPDELRSRLVELF